MRVSANDPGAASLRVVDFYSGREIEGVFEADDDAGWLRRHVIGQNGKLVMDGERIAEETLYRKITIERRNAKGEWVKA